MFCFILSVVTMDDVLTDFRVKSIQQYAGKTNAEMIEVIVEWKKMYIQLESDCRKRLKEMKASMKTARLEQQFGMKKIKEGPHHSLRESVLSNHTSMVWRNFKVINDQTLKAHPDKFHEKFFQDAGITSDIERGSLMSNYVFCLKQSLSDRRRRSYATLEKIFKGKFDDAVIFMTVVFH